jgi:predicted nucleic acid-binding protein
VAGRDRRAASLIDRPGAGLDRLILDTTVIAATALARGRVVVTADGVGFADLPGVAVRLVSGSSADG